MIDFVVERLDSPIEARFYEALLRELVWHRAVGNRAVRISLRSQIAIGRHRVDFAMWLTERGKGRTAQLVVECDGAAFHDTDRDRVRDSEVAAAGWHVRRFTGSQINADDARCAITTLATLDALTTTDAALRAALGVGT